MKINPIGNISMHVLKNFNYSFLMFFKRNEFNHIAILKGDFVTAETMLLSEQIII